MPTRGVVPACRTLDCVSVFALTVDDAVQACSVMAGVDAADPFSRPLPAPAPAPSAPALRLGVPRAADLFFDGDAMSAAAFEAARRHYAGLGARFVEIDLTPFLAVAKLLYDGAYVAERQAAVGDFIAAHPDAAHPVTRRIVEGASRFSAADAFRARYRLAELARETEPVWNRIDAMLVPTLPRPYGVAELEADPIGPNSRLGTYTNFVNLLDLCALAVPGPFRQDGFPSGTTLVAPRGRDTLLAAIGRLVQAAAGTPLGATGAAQPALADVPDRASPGEIEICVVGAHLSGMPLNHELQSLGARFLRAVATQPSYRLYALPGGPPRRPGLLRVADGEGGAIATEVWALSPEGFGRFVAGIPAPLGIGTLRLADGTTPKGFLCEPIAIEGAQDVSAHGGWRAYVASLA